MRLVQAAACVAAVVVGGALGCSSQRAAAVQPAAAPPGGSFAPNAAAQRQPTPMTAQERARDLIPAANLEVHDLAAMRSETSDAQTQRAIDRQVVEIGKYRDAVLADLSPRAGPAGQARLDADARNLERAMQAGAAAQAMPPSPPPIQRAAPPPGDHESLPPQR